MTTDLVSVKDIVVPDGIEAIEALRSWRLTDGLRSVVRDERWKPGEPMKAACVGGIVEKRVWTFARNGMSRENAEKLVSDAVDVASFRYYGSFRWALPHPSPTPSLPALDPPPGYGFSLESIAHDCPSENCSCGIYAVDDLSGVPAGDVYGKVKLWGKIVPGEKGYRAEYAYPSEFWVRPGIENDPNLALFGVPIVAKDDLPEAGLALWGSLAPISFDFGTPANKRSTNWVQRLMYGSIAANLSATLLSFGVAFHWWHF